MHSVAVSPAGLIVYVSGRQKIDMPVGLFYFYRAAFLFFVQHLRLVFRLGGFPGYDGIDTAVPAELAKLSEGLVAF